MDKELGQMVRAIERQTEVLEAFNNNLEKIATSLEKISDPFGEKGAICRMADTLDVIAGDIAHRRQIDQKLMEGSIWIPLNKN